jgi:hypothetical protein
MSPLLLAALMAAGPVAAQPGGSQTFMPKVEGRWLIVYAEEGGRRNNAWEQKVATVSDNTLSYESDGKKRTLNLSFGPRETLKARFGGEGSEGKSQNGVYIAGQDYLCISLGEPSGTGGGSSGSFILILRRQRGR